MTSSGKFDWGHLTGINDLSSASGNGIDYRVSDCSNRAALLLMSL